MNEETLFEAALSRSSEERAAFLEQACEGRPELRAAVEALLAAHEKAANLLDRPPAQTVDSGPGQARDDAGAAADARRGASVYEEIPARRGYSRAGECPVAQASRASPLSWPQPPSRSGQGRGLTWPLTPRTPAPTIDRDRL